MMRFCEVNKMSEDLKKIVEWFLSKKPMSPKKLQKLLYYAQAWTVTLTNEKDEKNKNRLFNERFEAWVHGPVIPEVYQKYKKHGYSNILFEGETPELDEEITDILEQVMEVYGNYNGNELENITHQESPWINARKGFSPLEICNKEISVDDMFDYYIKQAE